MRLVLLVGLPLALGACAHRHYALQPDLASQYLISCQGSFTWDHCYSKAEELCPAGYATLSEHADHGRNQLYIACQASSDDRIQVVPALAPAQPPT